MTKKFSNAHKQRDSKKKKSRTMKPTQHESTDRKKTVTKERNE